MTKANLRWFVRQLRRGLSTIRLVPHIVILLAAPAGKLVQQDLARWADILGLGTSGPAWPTVSIFIDCMTFTPEFRNVFYLRTGLLGRAFAWLCPKLRSLDIAPADIGPGLFIQHGEGTFVSARRIGQNCWIARQVVIGYSNTTDTPTIGNNVTILSGAKIVGDITVGDNATIGLNTVIVQNVPCGATMIGVPGKMVWQARLAAE